MDFREIAAPIIQRVLGDTHGQEEQAIRRALRDAYPFEDRLEYAYRVWCAEVKRQRSRRAPNAAAPGAPAPARDDGTTTPVVAALVLASSSPALFPRLHQAAPQDAPPASASPSDAPADPFPVPTETGPEIASQCRRRRPPLPRPHALSERDLTRHRVEYIPDGPRCRDCVHLGAIVSIVDLRGAKRLRRHCPVLAPGFTDVDWPCCPDFQRRPGDDGRGLANPGGPASDARKRD